MSDLRFIPEPVRQSVAGGHIDHAVFPAYRDGWVTYCGRPVFVGGVNQPELFAPFDPNGIFVCKRCKALVAKHPYPVAG